MQQLRHILVRGDQRAQLSRAAGEDHRGLHGGRGGGRPGDDLGRAVIAAHRVDHDRRPLRGSARR